MSPQSQPKHIPSPEEIAEACRAMQAAWTDQEEQRRCVGTARKRVEIANFEAILKDGHFAGFVGTEL